MPDWKAMGISRYRVWYDKQKKFFVVLDTWDESIKNIPENKIDDRDAIPDNSPAVKILSTEEVNSLLGTLKELGWLEKYAIIENIVPAQRGKTLQEIAIEKISDIAKSDFSVCDTKVSAEAVLAIREILIRL